MSFSRPLVISPSGPVAGDARASLHDLIGWRSCERWDSTLNRTGRRWPLASTAPDRICSNDRGEDRAFTIPLSAHAMALLARRRAENRFFGYTDRGWAFPTSDREGRVVPVQEPKVKGLPSPHRFRDTFATACLEAGIGSLETKVLMNHSLPSGDVTMGYQRPSLEHLRARQEGVTTFLLERARADEDEGRRESA